MLGFSTKSLNDFKPKPAEFVCELDFEEPSSKKYVFGLYYDFNSPERQEIIDCEVQQVKLVRDVSNHLTLLTAKNSLLNSPDVVQQFVSILKGETVVVNDKKSPVV